LVGKREITKSLHTSDLREAHQLARLERLKLDAAWAALKRRLAPAPSETLSEQEAWYLTSKWLVEAERQDQRKTAEARWETFDEAELDLAMASQEHNVAAMVYRAVKELLASEGIELVPGSPARIRLEGLLREAMREADRRRLRRAFPGAAVSTDPQFAGLSSASILQPVAKTTIEMLIDKYQGDPTRGQMSRKTKLKRDAQWQAIKEFFGQETAIEQIERDKVRGFVKLLQKLPSNATKHFPGATIFEAAVRGSQQGLPMLAVDTANDYLRTLGGLFRFAVNEGYLTKDPTTGLLIRAEKKVRAKDKRLPFSTDDLKAIFNAPLFTGCVDDEAGYAKPGSQIIRRGRFWVPLIALFAGMRLNEIAQLTLDDFAFEDETDVILIRGDDDGETKRIKTQAGERFVPVHPELKRIGLLSFVDDRRRASKTNGPLFPELPIGVTGYRSDPF
jgi:integrase